MCGRYTLRHPTGHRWIDPDVAGRLPPRYNIAPSQQVPVVGRDREGARVTRLALWGFHPHWLPEGRRSPINARLEGVAERPLFRGACARGRCLVPADGWYEWQAADNGPKQPFLFHRGDDAVFFFAGVAARDAEGRTTLAIVTREADAQSRTVHERMPVVLGDEAAATGWLDAPDAASAVAGADAANAGTLRIEPVSRRVNRPDNDDPRCVDPVTGDNER
jgi:putative SOS response-associated peptidase YedK